MKVRGQENSLNRSECDSGAGNNDCKLTSRAEIVKGRQGKGRNQRSRGKKDWGDSKDELRELGRWLKEALELQAILSGDVKSK